MNQCLVTDHLQDVERLPPVLTGKTDLVSGSILAHSAASSLCSQTVSHQQAAHGQGTARGVLTRATQWVNCSLTLLAQSLLCRCQTPTDCLGHVEWLRRTETGKTSREPWGNLSPGEDSVYNYCLLSLLTELFTLLDVNKKDGWFLH